DCAAVHGLYARFGVPIPARPRRELEGPRPSQHVQIVTITTLAARSGKGHRDENFPVASRLIHPRHRRTILAFYEFVRTADDIADHGTLAPPEKLALIDQLEATLLGVSNKEPVALALRAGSPHH